MVEIKFRTGNAAFHDDNGEKDEWYRNQEVARILREIADKIENGWDRGSVGDLNGNKIGDWRVS